MMENLKPSDIVEEVADVLRNAACGDGDRPNFLTAYQILDRLPHELRDRLVTERTLGGSGSGVSYSAITVVAHAADLAPSIAEYVDCRGLAFQIAGQAVSPGFEVCKLYRIDT